MSRFNSLTLSFAALALSQSAPLVAAQDEIIVKAAPVSLTQWSKRVERALDNGLTYPYYDQWQQPNEGVVRVGFICSDDGKPDRIAITRSSGSRDLDKAGMRAVRRIKTLHPLPSQFNHDQKFEAQLLFANTQDSSDRQMKTLRAAAAERNAHFTQNPGEIAMRPYVIGARK